MESDVELIHLAVRYNVLGMGLGGKTSLFGIQEI